MTCRRRPRSGCRTGCGAISRSRESPTNCSIGSAIRASTGCASWVNSPTSPKRTPRTASASPPGTSATRGSPTASMAKRTSGAGPSARYP